VLHEPECNILSFMETMRRRGVGLPVVLIITLVMSALALWGVTELRATREKRMVEAARRDITRMMDAVDEYQALYSTLPRRLGDLNKVGYREGGGMVVCLFAYNGGEKAGSDYLDMAIRHRSADSGAWTEYPAGQRMIKWMRIPDCKSARRGS
jgi:hypothetical protein